MKPYEWMKKIYEKHELTSDYQIAKILQVRPSKVSMYKAESVKYMDTDMCMKVAELLEIDPIKVLTDQAAEKSTKEEFRIKWERLSQAVVLGGAAILPFSGDAHCVYNMLC